LRRRAGRRRLPRSDAHALPGGRNEGQEAPHRAVVMAWRRSRLASRGAEAPPRLRQARRLAELVELTAVALELRLLGGDDVLRRICGEAGIRGHAVGARARV